MNKKIVVTIIFFVTLVLTTSYITRASIVATNIDLKNSNDQRIKLQHSRPFLHSIIRPNSINIASDGTVLAFFTKVISVEKDSIITQGKIGGIKSVFIFQTNEKTNFFQQGQKSSLADVIVGQYVTLRGSIVGDFSTSSLQFANSTTTVQTKIVRIPDQKIIETIKKNKRFNSNNNSILIATTTTSTSTQDLPIENNVTASSSTDENSTTTSTSTDLDLNNSSSTDQVYSSTNNSISTDETSTSTTDSSSNLGQSSISTTTNTTNSSGSTTTTTDSLSN